MKQAAFTLFLAFSLFFAGQAQNSSFFIGANGGVNFSKFKYTEDLSELYSTSSAIFGLNGGVSFGFEFAPFMLSSGIQYVQKGSKYTTDNFQDNTGTGYFSAKERLHFISIPILLGYRKYLNEHFGFTLAMGPSINMGLGGKIDETTEYFGSEDIRQENYTVKFGDGVNEDYRPLQVGFQLSPGFVFPINSRSKFTFNVTWDIGLGDSFNERYKDANTFFDSYKGKQMNRSTFFSIGYERHFTFGDRY